MSEGDPGDRVSAENHQLIGHVGGRPRDEVPDEIYPSSSVREMVAYLRDCNDHDCSLACIADRLEAHDRETEELRARVAEYWARIESLSALVVRVAELEDAFNRQVERTDFVREQYQHRVKEMQARIDMLMQPLILGKMLETPTILVRGVNAVICPECSKVGLPTPEVPTTETRLQSEER
jgi:hypothetical protein